MALPGKEQILDKHKSVEVKQSSLGRGSYYNFEYLNLTSAGLAMEEYANGWKVKYDELKAENERLKSEIETAIRSNENLVGRHIDWQNLLYKEQQEHTALQQQHQQLKDQAQKMVATQQKLHEAVQHLFDVRKAKNKGNLVLHAWNSVANWLYDARKSLSSWNEGKEVTDKQRLARTVVAIAEEVSKDAESAEVYLKSEGVDVEKVKADAAYLAWRSRLMAIVTEHTGHTAVINDEEARKWYTDGFTPEQCFRETWQSDGD